MPLYATVEAATTGLEGGVGNPRRSILVRLLSLSRTASTGSKEEFFDADVFTGLSFLFCLALA
jgi:hypothetical protein